MIPGPLYNVFGKSPIKPLQQHIAKAYDCAHHLFDFFAAVLEHEWHLAEEKRQIIAKLEHEADIIKRNLRGNLHKGLFLPVSREDVLQILTVQDRIANKAKDIAGIIIGRRMHIPEAIAPSYLGLLKRCMETVKLAQKAINELDELLETGFRGSEVNIVEEMITDISEAEHDADDLQIKVRQELYEIENTLSPIDAMFLYEVIDLTGKIADRAEQVGNRLQLLLAR